MSLSDAQGKLYWRLWSGLRKVVPGVDRHETHAALGLPESHLDWGNRDFDEWVKHCQAKSKPDDLRAQVRQAKMPEIRQRVFIDHLLRALDLSEDYAEGIVRKQNRGGKHGGPMVTLDTLSEAGLEAVKIALKKECRRRWKTKAMLLAEIKSKCEPIAFGGAKMDYEALLITLSELRKAAVNERGEDPDWTV